MRVPPPVLGANSASKALALLRQVGAGHPQGTRLTDLVEATGVDRSTAHRLLQCLVDEGFAERAPGSKRYRLGLEALQLGLASATMGPLVERMRPLMQRLARTTGDTVFFVVRSGDHALCLHREAGSYPIKVFIVEPGSRRLLGVSAAGVGMLARLPDTDVQALYRRNAAEYQRLGVDAGRFAGLVQATRRAGFCELGDLRTGESSGVGCAFRLSSNSHAGISIAAINARMSADRRQALGLQLREELAAFEWTDAGA